MPMFSRGIPRLAVVALCVAAFTLVAPETLARSPNLCLWRHLFHLPACPACGTLRALAAFFHGQLREALAFNRNVAVTGPGLAAMLLADTARALRKLAC